MVLDAHPTVLFTVSLSSRSVLAPGRSLATVLALIGVLASSPPAYSQATVEEANRAREIFVEELGCSGCHGREGEGGLGPSLAQSGLTLAKFVKQVRLPEDVMPPFFPVLASDDQLAAVYGWLGGVDTVDASTPLELEVDGLREIAPGSPSVVTVTIGRAGESERTDHSGVGSRAYRLTVLARDNAPPSRLRVDYRSSDAEEWREAVTEAGRVVLRPDHGHLQADAPRSSEAVSFDLRITVPSGRYTFVVEALALRGADDPVSLGLVSAVVEVGG